MKRTAALWIGILPLLLLSSCVTGLKMDDIQSVRRGMGQKEFESQVKAAPKLSFPLQNEDVQYAIDVYLMQTGTTPQSQYIWTNYGGYVTTTQVPVYDDYYFVFDDKGLMFWGFMNELQKSDDELIQTLAPKIDQEAKEQARKKAQASSVKTRK